MKLSDILSQMADYTTDSIIITRITENEGHVQQEIVYVNKSFTDLTGYSYDDAVGKSPVFLHGPKTDKNVLARIKNSILQRKSVTAELLNYSKDGYEYWGEINMNPIFDTGSTDCMYYLATERDITERKNAESQLLRAIEKAEAGTKAKSEFLANMSHELRTPMNGILGLAEILQNGDLTEEVRECVDAIQVSGQSLLGILNDILDLSKIEAQELAIEKYPFRTNDILKNIRDLTGLTAARKGLDYNIQINMNVPEWCMGDGKRIQQIIFNLVGNALKFTEKGSVDLSVDWREKEGRPCILVQVRDTGIGIPDEFHQHLFAKFSQADSSISRKFGGTGLGLAITKYLVEMMNGTIGFTSKLHQGTTFYVSIPLDRAPKQEIQKTEISIASENVLLGIDLQHVRALIVEDHPINQMLVVKWLKKLGLVTIDCAENGFESLTKLRNNTYDFILMDCQMPELDGYETTSLIRDMEKQMYRRTPIIAMTANAMLGEREKCIQSGMDDYLSKPLKFSEFQSCIARWLGAQAQNTAAETTANTQSGDAPLDVVRLHEFTEGDKDMERMVINLFLETAYETLDTLKAAREMSDMESWSKAAHKLKGASGNLGAMDLHKLCSDAELQITISQEEKDLLLSGIHKEFSRVEGYLKALN